MIKLVRESSSTPNIQNKDDVRMIRYAYSGQNGIVKSFGSELSINYENATSKIKIGSGRIVLDGWEVDIDEAGFEVPVTLYSSVQVYTIYLEVNALVETATIKSLYNNTEEYPVVDAGDDLTEIPNGTARLPLFHVLFRSQAFVSSEKIVDVIEYAYDIFKNILESDRQTVKKATHSQTAEFATNAKNCVPNSDEKTYSGFLRDSDGTITINNNVLKLTRKYPNLSFSIIKGGGSVVLNGIYSNIRYSCRYSVVIPNYGSTQGYIDIEGKFAVNNSQIFTIKVPTSNISAGLFSYQEIDLYIYRNPNTGEMNAIIQSESTYSGIQVLLSNFEEQVA